MNLHSRVLVLRLFQFASAACALLLIGTVGALWWEHQAELTLPKPSGSFPVGRAIYDWVDNSGWDVAAPHPGIKRELLAWIWYPAAPQSGETDQYTPAQIQPKPGMGRPPFPFRLVTRDASKVYAHSLRHANLPPGGNAYPVLIFRAGGSTSVMNYSSLLEDLASHGYVVVGLDAPYRTLEVVFPDGRAFERTPENNPELVSGAQLESRAERLLAAWSGDIGFALDRLQQLTASEGGFKSRLDLNRVGVFGHSFGGAQAADFCSRDARCQAGIDIDGSLHGSVIKDGIQAPFMFLLSEQGDFSSSDEVRQIEAEIQSVYDRLPPGEKLRVTIRGANHFFFSDDVALLKSHILLGILRRTGIVRIDGPRQLAITAYCVRKFFDRYVKERGVSAPELSSAKYPEIQSFAR